MYDFFDQSFDVNASNVKTHSTGNTYIELNYPGDNNKPVLKYNELYYYPYQLVIAKRTADPNKEYVMVIETFSKVNGVNSNKMFIHVNLVNSSSSPNTSLTALFAAPSPAIVSLNALFGDPSVSSGQNKIYNKTSPDLTLYIANTITVKIEDNLKKITGTAVGLPSIFPTITDSTEPNPKDVSLKLSQLTQRQRCTRSIDKASTVVPIVKANPTSVQTNILVLVILGLCVAAFFPSIYYGLVCLPAGDKTEHGAIHAIYLLGALSLIVPLFVRGFKDGDLAAQVWGVGIVVLVLIFGWQYVNLSSKQRLRCVDSDVMTNFNVLAHFGQFFEKRIISILLLAGLVTFGISASVKSADDAIFGWLMGTQAIITVVAPWVFSRF